MKKIKKQITSGETEEAVESKLEEFEEHKYILCMMIPVIVIKL